MHRTKEKKKKKTRRPRSVTPDYESVPKIRVARDHEERSADELTALAACILTPENTKMLPPKWCHAFNSLVRLRLQFLKGPVVEDTSLWQQRMRAALEALERLKPDQPSYSMRRLLETARGLCDLAWLVTAEPWHTRKFSFAQFLRGDNLR